MATLVAPIARKKRADGIPLGMVVTLFVFDLLTQKRVLAVTVLGGVLFWAADPVSDWIIAMPFSHQLVFWAQHHP